MIRNNRNIKISILITSILTILFSLSYAFINIRLFGEKRQVLSTGELSLELEEDNNNLTISNSLPMYDEVGMIQEPFTFKVINNSNVPLNYIVRLVDTTTGEKLDTSIVKYGLTKDGTDVIDFLSNLENGQVDSGIISSKQTIRYSLRLWIDFNVKENNLIADRSLSYKVEVIAGQLDGTKRNIILDPAGGTLDTVSKSVIVGEMYGELPTLTKAGYNFLGWFNEKNEVISKESILDSFTEKLTAKWGAGQYTVTLNPNGGTVSPNNKQIKFNDMYGNLPTPTKTDSKFVGWYTSLTGGEKIESTTVMNKTSNHTLYARWKAPYTDTSGANKPILSNELIPVNIASNGEVTRADITEKWYDYDKQNWANAVILLDKTINYSEGQTIPEDNIESYFVWIPRYKYKIFDSGGYPGVGELENAVQTIEIQFEDKNIMPSKGKDEGSWLSHPAFTEFDSNGFWVGKFESGYKGATTTASAQVNANTSSKLIIKPNMYAWRNLTLGNMFKASYDYSRSIESHMMKNTEWGAAAYLSHSKYGKNGEVYINNNSAYVTGCGGDTASEAESTSCKNAYGSKTDNIYNQSTTGNISGIFDMSGGAWEYVAGYNLQSTKVGGNSEITTLYSDFFSNNKWSPYMNGYINDYNDEQRHSYRILGDATGELGPFKNNSSSWYNDYANFVTKTNCWFSRGGRAGSKTAAGTFSYATGTGTYDTASTFRVILIP